VEAYFQEVLAALSDVHTELRDLAVREWADTGVITCVIDQTYRYEGRNERVVAPPRCCFAARTATGASP
jgi:hypothetical protein